MPNARFRAQDVLNSVPAYQRSYAWETEHVEALLKELMKVYPELVNVSWD